MIFLKITDLVHSSIYAYNHYEIFIFCTEFGEVIFNMSLNVFTMDTMNLLMSITFILWKLRRIAKISHTSLDLFLAHVKNNQILVPKFMHKNIHDNFIYDSKKNGVSLNIW